MQALKSKTIRFMLVMAMLESIVAGLHFVEPLITSDQFALISFGLGILTSTGGVWLRLITTEPVSHK